jgi:hypothetical protein
MIRILALLALAFAAPALAADSVVLGHGLSNSYLSKRECPGNSVCLDAKYVWALRANRTVAGPPIHGDVRAIATQHADATQQFVSSVELFVLRPIHDVALRKSSGATFYLISLSPRDPEGRYCLSVNPETVGLHLAMSQLYSDADSYCFDARLL